MSVFKLFFSLAIFFLFGQVSAAVSSPEPSDNEVDAGRWATAIPELGWRTYDLDGQKSEWLLGTSIMGNPDLDYSVMGLGMPTHRLPSKLAGLFTRRLHYDASQLGVNGENGILREPSREQPVDTPVTRINWERFAFDGNSFGLEFRRLMVDSVELDIGLASHSDSESDDFRYQDVTHQPYFALGRDSSSIPFTGRSIGMNSMHFKPALTWYLPRGEISASVSLLNIDDDDVTNHQVIRDSLDWTSLEYQTDPFNVTVASQTYGIEGELRPLRTLQLGASFYYGTHDIDYDSLPEVVKSVQDSVDEDGDTLSDTTWTDTERSIHYESMNGAFLLGARGRIFNPSVNMEYEFLDGDSRYFQDRELGYLQLEDTLGPLSFRTQSGAQRNSSIDDSVQYTGALSATGTLRLPWHFSLLGSYRRDTRFPDIDELRYTNTGRFAYPNANLKAEQRERTTGDLQWDAGGLFYGLGIRYEKMKYPIRQRWVTGSGLDSIQSAYQWINLKKAETLDWIASAGFRISNWEFHLERAAVLRKLVRPMDTPDLFYKGSVYWHNRFVNDRLGVMVRWDFQWFDNRWDCEINEDGEPELVELKHYLALNFEARMQILTFEFYTRIDNLNHSQYEPAAGYTPEGVRFLYGIVWRFDN